MSNPGSSPTSASAHHDHAHTPLCRPCGAPTTAPTPAPWSGTSDSPPPAYRPIRLPAINAPTNTAAIVLSPVPQALPVPPAAPPHAFQTPTKRIASPDDIARFRASLHGRKLSDPLPAPPSAAVSALLDLISALTALVASAPPLPHNSRYGNPAFRLWHEKLTDSAGDLIARITSTAASPADLAGAEVELAPYLLDSFGNATRIDYGTGHETNFAAFLYCLARLGLITEPDYPAVVLRVFAAYLNLMRTLQDTYQLEPAGSHGVWGLDDFHFLPFIFGAAQLIDHKYMKPKSIHNPDILENLSKEYMYLACVAYVKKIKKGPFAEHSPMLDDISGVPNWKKVNSGLLKMYKAEVLEKVPIMQHFLFGSLIKWCES